MRRTTGNERLADTPDFYSTRRASRYRGDKRCFTIFSEFAIQFYSSLDHANIRGFSALQNVDEQIVDVCEIRDVVEGHTTKNHTSHTMVLCEHQRPGISRDCERLTLDSNDTMLQRFLSGHLAMKYPAFYVNTLKPVKKTFSAFSRPMPLYEELTATEVSVA